MEFSFFTKELRGLCLSEHLARHEFGEVVAGKLKARLADLAAAQFVSDLFVLPGKPTELPKDLMMIELIQAKVLVFESGHRPHRRLPIGQIDWTQVRRIQIMGIENAGR